ncbi:hypothetical protein PR048_016742 [Dryococelus australis]|uniref:Uncharacterized protein n=1 Tax=Dryococelus australis TaxID=614101 RepID=A0ABQ9H7I8_9NEOP|nr:hypothetical protein PR048_016742 [Dryococelus australis]
MLHVASLWTRLPARRRIVGRGWCFASRTVSLFHLGPLLGPRDYSRTVRLCPDFQPVAERGDTTISNWNRIREDPGSIPGLAILISACRAGTANNVDRNSLAYHLARYPLCQTRKGYKELRLPPQHCPVSLSTRLLVRNCTRSFVPSRASRSNLGDMEDLTSRTGSSGESRSNPPSTHGQQTTCLISRGAAVAERLASSSPAKAIWAQSPAGWESRRTMPLVGGFSRGSPASHVPLIPALLHTHLSRPHRL